MANFYKKSNQLGRSMIEMLGVLAIIGVLSIASIAGYTKAMEKHNLNKLKDQFSIIISNIATARANGRNSTQLNSTVINALHILPQEMGTTDNCHHALGGRCYIGTGGNYGEITVRFADLSKSACVEMATFYAPTNGWIAINAANNFFLGTADCATEDGSKTCLSRNKYTLSEALKECRGKKNAVIFFLGLKV